MTIDISSIAPFIVNGEDGVSVTSALIGEDRHLRLTLSNDTSVDAGSLQDVMDAALANSEFVAVDSGQVLVTQVDAGTVGSAYSLSMSAAQPKWVSGTLGTNAVVTVTAFPAGSQAVLKLTQGASPWTLGISDGTTTVPVSIPTAAGTFFEVKLSSADGSTIDVELLGVPGAQGQVGQAGLTGAQGATGAKGDTGPSGASPNPPSSGEETFDRLWCASAATMTSGFLRLSYFTARNSETVSKILLTTAASGAGATPTLVRAGVWSVDSSDNLTALLASTANDTSLLATGATEYLKSFSASFDTVSGTRYAIGLLVVTGSSAPTVPALTLATAVLSGTTQNRRRVAANISGQSDLPSSATVTSSQNATFAPYFELVP